MSFPLLFVPMSEIGSISMVLIPSISSMMSKNDYSSIEENINKSINVSVFISAIFIPLYLSVGDLIGIVLFDNVMSGVLLQISAICVLPITLCNLTGSILNALSLEGKSFLNYILGSVVLIASIVIFTPIIGINSIIVSFFLSMTLISLLNLSKIKKKIPNFNLNIINLTMKYSLIITPSSLIGHFISNIMLNFFPVLISGVIGGSIAIILVLSLIKTFNLYDVSAFLDMIKRKRKSKQI